MEHTLPCQSGAVAGVLLGCHLCPLAGGSIQTHRHNLTYTYLSLLAVLTLARISSGRAVQSRTAPTGTLQRGAGDLCQIY